MNHRLNRLGPLPRDMEEQKEEKIIVRSNQSNEAPARIVDINFIGTSHKHDDSKLIRIEEKKEEMVENKQPMLDFSK